MKLYGTTTSPYVRRLRIYLADQDYEFVIKNIFGKERKEIKQVNPTLKIPMFEDESNPNCPILVDSGVIQNYLATRIGDKPLSISKQNTMAIINACNDSLVNMMILFRSGVDTSENKLYFNIQHERNKESFDYLDKAVADGLFDDWDYVSISLLVLIEWAQFRNLFDFAQHKNLLTFIAKNQDKAGVVATKPKD